MANINNILWMKMETRRRQQVEAAERRRNERASRGIKDPDSEEMERREQELRSFGGANLKWTAD